MTGEGEIALGNYLLARLVELGAETIQGVPGDYNMGFLDQIDDHPDLRWCGNANELNAAYSADGYARTPVPHAKDSKKSFGRGKIGAVVTTFGVGELSALNGVAGCFAERLPLVHIVGVPSTSAQGNRSLLHHTLGDGRFDAFEEMSRKISIGNVRLGDFKDDSMGAAKAIDRVLALGYKQARPVYVSLPTDMVNLPVPAASLHEALPIEVRDNDPDAEKACISEIFSQVEKAKDPIIIVDACAIRHDCLEEAHELVDKSGLSVFSTPMGKGAVDEGHGQFGGIYVGSNTDPKVKERVENADLLLSIGTLMSDFNTANFTYRTPRSATIEFHSSMIMVGHATYQGVTMKKLLPKVSAVLEKGREARLKATKSRLPIIENKLPTREEEGENAGEDGKAISQAWLWPRLGQFLRHSDQVIAETGTSSFGSLGMKLPPSRLPSFHSQILWGSIGWSVGACLGVSLASREENLGRVMLFVGDGSLQLTVQEISTMIREGLTPIIFVLSNEGYEIERQIHGPQRSYNNVATWDHQALLTSFSKPTKESSIGGDRDNFKKSHKNDPIPSKTKYWAVKNKEEMEALLNNEDFNKADKLQLVEIFMRRGDAPKALLGQAEVTQQSNRY